MMVFECWNVVRLISFIFEFGSLKVGVGLFVVSIWCLFDCLMLDDVVDFSRCVSNVYLCVVGFVGVCVVFVVVCMVLGW